MAEYARLALRKIQAAMSFIVDYFSLDRDEFVRRYFAGGRKFSKWQPPRQLIAGS